MTTQNALTWTDSSGSYCSVREQYPAYFYPQPWHTSVHAPLLTQIMPVRPVILARYSKKFAEKALLFERSFFPTAHFDPLLPNIVEQTLWWVAYLTTHHYHGLRSMRTPSSTRLADGQGVLCTLLLVTDALGLAGSYRSP